MLAALFLLGIPLLVFAMFGMLIADVAEADTHK